MNKEIKKTILESNEKIQSLTDKEKTFMVKKVPESIRENFYAQFGTLDQLKQLIDEWVKLDRKDRCLSLCQKLKKKRDIKAIQLYSYYISVLGLCDQKTTLKI